MSTDVDTVQTYEKDLRESFVHKRPDPQGNPPTTRVTSNNRNRADASEIVENNAGNRSGKSGSSDKK